MSRRGGSVPVAARLRAAREAATPTAEELAARDHTRGRKPASGISQRELGARYDRARGPVEPGTTSKRAVLRWEDGKRKPTREARRLLEQVLALPRGALDQGPPPQK